MAFSAANAPMANREMSRAMRMAIFMGSSPFVSWLPASILVPWVLKCLTEVGLLYVALAHRVRYVWAVALYTLSTTCLLMVLADLRYSHYAKVEHGVNLGAGGVMLLVGVGLVQLLRKGRREYGKVTLIYVMLCISQMVVGMLPHLPVHVYNLLALGSWIAFMLWLTYECHWMPWLRLSISEVAWLMSKDLRG